MANNYTFCMICTICPRGCFIDRAKSKGYCGQKENLKISKVMFHHFEEPIISGDEKAKGSGAIFFTGCNLRCVFCQNYPISRGGKGKNISVKKLVSIFKKLERKGALNINLVSPTQFSTKIIEALKIYKPRIPVVWNSNGYETVETIRQLKGLVDVFLVDLKYSDNALALKYSGANNYVEYAYSALKEMKKICPVDIIENGLIKRGIIVRQLILPSYTKNSLGCMKFILDNLGKDTIVSIMSQYEPMYDAKNYNEINRHITNLEYKRVVNFAIKNDMTNCYTQELSSANTKYTPKF